jgi:hypothetical protein
MTQSIRDAALAHASKAHSAIGALHVFTKTRGPRRIISALLWPVDLNTMARRRSGPILEFELLLSIRRRRGILALLSRSPPPLPHRKVPLFGRISPARRHHPSLYPLPGKG